MQEISSKSAALVRYGVVPSDAMASTVRDLIRTEGERAAMARFGLDRTTLARVAGGLPVRKGTIAMVRQGLDTPTSESAA